MISDFCLIEKIHHNFLVLRMIELACKTFMPIQTLDLDRVRVLQTIQIKLILLFVWVERAVLGGAKNALKFK